MPKTNSTYSARAVRKKKEKPMPPQTSQHIAVSDQPYLFTFSPVHTHKGMLLVISRVIKHITAPGASLFPDMEDTLRTALTALGYNGEVSVTTVDDRTYHQLSRAGVGSDSFAWLSLISEESLKEDDPD